MDDEAATSDYSGFESGDASGDAGGNDHDHDAGGAPSTGVPALATAATAAAGLQPSGGGVSNTTSAVAAPAPAPVTAPAADVYNGSGVAKVSTGFAVDPMHTQHYSVTPTVTVPANARVVTPSLMLPTAGAGGGPSHHIGVQQTKRNETVVPPQVPARVVRQRSEIFH